MKTENLKANQQQDKQNRALRAPRDSGDAGNGEMPTLMSHATAGARALRYFVSAAELESIGNACLRSEDGEFYRATLARLGELVDTMPGTYETDGQGDSAVAYLHYFSPAYDWYIVERDCEEEQHQAFGLACLHDDELGYISIHELLECGAELDLHWETKTLAKIKAERAMSNTNYVGHPMHY